MHAYVGISAQDQHVHQAFLACAGWADRRFEMTNAADAHEYGSKHIGWTGAIAGQGDLQSACMQSQNQANPVENYQRDGKRGADISMAIVQLPQSGKQCMVQKP